jgi:transcriptional regulator with GAF, ATPase, and Fis domain
VAGAFASALQRRQSAERLHATEELNRSLRDEVRELRDRLDAETAYRQKSVLRAEGFDDIVGVSAVLAKVLYQVEQVAGPTPRADPRGDGDGQGPRGPCRTRPQPAQGPAARDRELRGAARRAHRERAVRLREGGLHGAVARTLGRFEMAHGGTILLDEIGEMPLAVQAKLLRVLEGGTFERLGSSRTSKVDVRVIAATNRTLPGRCARDGSAPTSSTASTSSRDHPAPARARRGRAAPRLALHQRRQAALGRKIKRVPERLMRALETYPWPGNVRELENVIVRA